MTKLISRLYNSYNQLHLKPHIHNVYRGSQETRHLESYRPLVWPPEGAVSRETARLKYFSFRPRRFVSRTFPDLPTMQCLKK